MLLPTHSPTSNKAMTGNASLGRIPASSLFTKGIQLSLMILWGTPNRTIMFSLMNFATTPLVALRSGIASTYLVKYFVTTMIHIYPLESGLTGPTKSSSQVWNDHGMTMLYKLCG